MRHNDSYLQAKPPEAEQQLKNKTRSKIINY